MRETHDERDEELEGAHAGVGVCAGVVCGGLGRRGRGDDAVTGGENVRGWTVAEENANAFSFALEADEQGVWLVARPKGTVLLLR